MFRTLGGGCGCMSTVFEVIAAAHCGLPLVGIAMITNMAAGCVTQPLSGAEVNETAERRGARAAPSWWQKVVEKIVKFHPQGGIISPTLANITLDGLQTMLAEKYHKKFVNRKTIYYPKVHLVRYADDFIITGRSKEALEEIKPVINVCNLCFLFRQG